MAVAMNAGPFKGTYAVEAGGAATESIGGVAIIVLTILALFGVAERILTPVAGIIFGIAFLIEGAAIAAKEAAILEQAEKVSVEKSSWRELELGGGATIDMTVGAAAVVLGVLSLIGIVPGILMACLTTAAGAALILSTGAVQRLNDLQVSLTTESEPLRRHVVRLATSSAAAVQFLCGVATTVLGILGLTRAGFPMTMSTVGLLVLGCAITLSGTALASRMTKLMAR